MLFRDLGWSTFSSGLFCVLVFCGLWLWRRLRWGEDYSLCPDRLVLPFVFLALLALDRGLLRWWYFAGALLGRLGPENAAWPPMGSGWTLFFRIYPVVLAAVLAVWGFAVMNKSRPPRRLIAATGVLAVVALMQGMFSLRWITTSQISSLFTDQPVSPPWPEIWVIIPGATVLIAIAMVVGGHLLSRRRLQR